MDVMRFLLLAVAVTMLALFVRERNRELGLLLSLAGCILLITQILGPFGMAISGLNEIATKGRISLGYIDVVLKAGVIAFMTEFASQICQDGGEGALAKKVEFGGKILILLIAIPILSAVLDGLLSLLP